MSLFAARTPPTKTASQASVPMMISAPYHRVSFFPRSETEAIRSADWVGTDGDDSAGVSSANEFAAIGNMDSENRTDIKRARVPAGRTAFGNLVLHRIANVLPMGPVPAIAVFIDF